MKQYWILNADLFFLEQHNKIKRFRCQVEIRGRKWISQQEAERGRLQFNLHDIFLQEEKSIDSDWPVTRQLLSVLQICQGSMQFSACFAKAFKRKIVLESLIGWGRNPKGKQAAWTCASHCFIGQFSTCL